uniref:Uncharacterized protein n=1 Tax=Rhizophora mucronata TaxID=61149 RepID=A0A2P2R2S0_RHIMU
MSHYRSYAKHSSSVFNMNHLYPFLLPMII